MKQRRMKLCNKLRTTIFITMFVAVEFFLLLQNSLSLGDCKLFLKLPPKKKTRKSINKKAYHRKQNIFSWTFNLFMTEPWWIILSNPQWRRGFGQEFPWLHHEKSINLCRMARRRKRERESGICAIGIWKWWKEQHMERFSREKLQHSKMFACRWKLCLLVHF